MDKELQRIRAQIAVGRVDYIPSGSLHIRDAMLVSNSAMTDQTPSDLGKRKKRRSPASRARYREKRKLRRLQKAEGYATSENGNSEYETDDAGGPQSRPQSLSPTFRRRRMDESKECAGLEVHSNRFDILEDDPDEEEEEEESLAMILHDGTANARIIHEARMAKGRKWEFAYGDRQQWGSPFCD